MKCFIMVLISLAGLMAQAVECRDNPYIEMNPSTTLKENECVFKNNNVFAQQTEEHKQCAKIEGKEQIYDFIITACDGRTRTSLTLVSGRLKPGHCTYELFQKMSGDFMTKIMKPCPIQKRENIQQDHIIDEEIEFMPPAPEQTNKAVQKPVVKKKTTSKPATPNEETPEIENYIPPADVDTDF